RHSVVTARPSPPSPGETSLARRHPGRADTPDALTPRCAPIKEKLTWFDLPGDQLVLDRRRGASRMGLWTAVTPASRWGTAAARRRPRGRPPRRRRPGRRAGG